MKTTTTNSMILLAQRNSEKINAFVPKELRDRVKEMAAKKNMNESMYIKIALINQLEKDLSESA